LEELIVQEQFLDACSKVLTTFLEEQKQQTLNDLIDAADRYLKAHDKTFGPPKKHLQKDGCHGRQFTPSTRVNAGNHKPY
jgi:hypothetical protein